MQDSENEATRKLESKMTVAQYVEEFLLCFGVDILDEKCPSYKVNLGDFLSYVCVVSGSLFKP